MLQRNRSIKAKGINSLFRRLAFARALSTCFLLLFSSGQHFKMTSLLREIPFRQRGEACRVFLVITLNS